ncbi:hypothetical protein PYCCODRAFT_163718 [Trametes coccinea BRFM310]|uniref:Uncharacterized protein n=1 Tax=Trametes coccinea (strain BRFM310) TaxID=1353009 RepID=A0A1Y2IS29_TRAC3|nr:hypothetical protein PYCCODRAFT_163718 [Trametes coccinea BRFM310]
MNSSPQAPACWIRLHPHSWHRSPVLPRLIMRRKACKEVRLPYHSWISARRYTLSHEHTSERCDYRARQTRPCMENQGGRRRTSSLDSGCAVLARLCDRPAPVPAPSELHARDAASIPSDQLAHARAALIQWWRADDWVISERERLYCWISSADVGDGCRAVSRRGVP